jgi:hypothetical protein
VIGIEHLLALRKRGFKPAQGVIVWCSEQPLKRCTIRAPWFDATQTAEVVIGADEQPERLDLRPLYGMPVVVSGASQARCAQVAKAVWNAGGHGAITSAETGAYLGSIEEAAGG